MLRINNIKIPVKHSKEDVLKQAAEILGVRTDEIKEFKIRVILYMCILWT